MPRRAVGLLERCPPCTNHLFGQQRPAFLHYTPRVLNLRRSRRGESRMSGYSLRAVRWEGGGGSKRGKGSSHPSCAPSVGCWEITPCFRVDNWYVTNGMARPDCAIFPNGRPFSGASASPLSPAVCPQLNRVIVRLVLLPFRLSPHQYFTIELPFSAIIIIFFGGCSPENCTFGRCTLLLEIRVGMCMLLGEFFSQLWKQ